MESRRFLGREYARLYGRRVLLVVLVADLRDLRCEVVTGEGSHHRYLKWWRTLRTHLFQSPATIH